MVEIKVETETQHNNTDKTKSLPWQTLCGLLSNSKMYKRRIVDYIVGEKIYGCRVYE